MVSRSVRRRQSSENREARRKIRESAMARDTVAAMAEDEMRQEEFEEGLAELVEP